MLVELHRRVRLSGIEGNDPFLIGSYEELAEEDAVDEELKLETIAYLEQYIQLVGETNQQVMTMTRASKTAGELADASAASSRCHLTWKWGC